MEEKQRYYYEPTILVGLQQPGSRMHQVCGITERQSMRIRELMQEGMSHFDAVFQAQKDCPKQRIAKEEYNRMMNSEFIRHEQDI